MVEVVVSYLTGFFSVVVVNCVQMVNWDSCFPVDVWLMPYVEDYRRFKEVEPYEGERLLIKGQPVIEAKK